MQPKVSLLGTLITFFSGRNPTDTGARVREEARHQVERNKELMRRYREIPDTDESLRRAYEGMQERLRKDKAK